MYDTDDYAKKQGDQFIDYPRIELSPNFNIFNLFAVLLYLILIISVFIPFVPINNGAWFSIGMGKYIGIAAIFAIYALFVKNYFAAFFISIFASFFVFHEVIIFYDNYAIELGKELTSEGTFRFVFDIFKDAFQVKFGAFWASLSSLSSLVIVLIGWIKNTVDDNKLASKKVIA